MRCDQCKFWTGLEKDHSFGIYAEFGFCNRTLEIADMIVWKRAFTVWEMKPEFEYATACTSDISDAGSSYLTRPQHFCAMFQQK